MSAQFAGQILEEVALDIGIHAEKGDGRDDVYRAAQGGPIRDDDGGVAENGPRPLGELRVLGQQRQRVTQRAQHGLVVRIELSTPSAADRNQFFVAIPEFAEETVLRCRPCCSCPFPPASSEKW